VVWSRARAPIWLGAYLRLPDACPVDQHCGHRLDLTIFGFIIGIAAVITIVTAIGFVGMVRRRSARPGLPHAIAKRRGL
jgi:hypothetical protein